MIKSVKATLRDLDSLKVAFTDFGFTSSAPDEAAGNFARSDERLSPSLGS